MALLPGWLSPDPADETPAWIRIGLALLLVACGLLPPGWVYIGYAVASVPAALMIVTGRRFALLALLPPAFALLKGGYVPLWTLAALSLGLLPMFLKPREIMAGAWAAGVLACAIEFWSMGAGTVEARREIVIVGDSLCKFGLLEELRKRVDVPVRDEAVSGVSAHETLEQIVPKIEGVSDRCFVVELGGHDTLKGFPLDQLESDLDGILRRLGEGGNSLILVEIPNSIFRDGQGGMYRRLARRHDAAMIPDTMVRRFVLQPGLSNDGLHPNLEGSRLFAEEIAARLE